MYSHYLRYSDVYLAETKKKQDARKRTSSKWSVQERSDYAICAQRIPERDGSQYLYLCIVSQDTQMLIAGLMFLQIFICKHLTRSLDSYLFLYIGATTFLLSGTSD